MTRPAIFLDRDGTIIREAEYLADPAGVELLPGAAEGIKSLKLAGYKIVVVSNQSGVARGYFDEDTVKRVNRRMQDLLEAEGAELDGIYYCPHFSGGTVLEYAITCECRKPGPGMLTTAACDLDIELAQSWVIGDKASDIEFGRNSGLRTVLVLTGYGEQTRSTGFPSGAGPDAIAADLAAAAQAVISTGVRGDLRD